MCKEKNLFIIYCQGRIQPKVEGGGAICRVGARNVVKRKHTNGVQKFWGLFREKFSGFSIESAIDSD